MPYIIDENNLEEGDIVLTDGSLALEKSKISFFIKLILRSNYSHVSIYVGRGIMEAVGSGVRYYTFPKMPYKMKKGVKILRYKELSKENKKSIKEYILKRHVVKYAPFRAGFSAFGLNFRNNIYKQFCSKLVAEAYESAGIKLFNKKIQNVHPKDFEVSDKLEEIKVQFKEITEEKIIELQNLNTEEEKIKKLNIMLSDICGRYEKKFKSYSCTLNDIVYYCSNKEEDREIAEALEISGYTTWWLDDFEKRKFAYNYDDKYEAFKSKPSNEILDKNLALIEELVEKSKKYYAQYFLHRYLEYKDKNIRKELLTSGVFPLNFSEDIANHEEKRKDVLLCKSLTRRALIDYFNILMLINKQAIESSLLVIKKCCNLKLYQEKEIQSFMEKDITVENYKVFIKLIIQLVENLKMNNLIEEADKMIKVLGENM